MKMLSPLSALRSPLSALRSPLSALRSPFVALIALSLSIPLFGQSPLDGSAGVDLDDQGFIFAAPAVTAHTTLTGSTSWLENLTYQGHVVPASQLTGLLPSGSALNLEDLLPLKTTKLCVMLGSAGSAPSAVGTVLDSQGIMTNGLTAELLTLHDAEEEEDIPFASIVDGVAVLHSAVKFGVAGGISTPLSGALLVGANLGNTVSAERSVVLGGSNNEVEGIDSAVIAGTGNVTVSPYSSIIGASYSKILGESSHYSTIIGGSGNELKASAGNYNAIIGGGSNQFVSGGYLSAIIAGQANKITSGAYHQVILGGQGNEMKNLARNSTIIGGQDHVIEGTSNSNDCHAFIAGGVANSVEYDSFRCSVVGGNGNSVSGWTNTIIGANAATISGGSYGLAVGVGTRIGTGSEAQVVLGKYNTADNSKALIVGNGGSDTTRGNALTVNWDGDVTASGTVSAEKVILTDPDTSDISMGVFTSGTP